MSLKLDFSVVNKGEVQNKAIVMIHGWQGNKESFKSIASLLNVSNCSWYFPEAPYEIDGMIDKKTWAYEKSPGIWEVDEPKKLLTDFMLEEVLSKFDSQDVYVMGFSQGAAVCYRVFLSFNQSLGGIFPIGGFIRSYPGQPDDEVRVDISNFQKNTPILIGHGKDDDVVPVDAAKMAYTLLKNKCNNVKLHVYNGRHKIGVEYLKDVKKLIENKLEYIKEVF